MSQQVSAFVPVVFQLTSLATPQASAVSSPRFEPGASTPRAPVADGRMIEFASLLATPAMAS